ncbi:hypothetical protein [Brevundimonas sp. SORGH_AS_0993]|uniref:hypothetical protein n=1 Tax=Brevundimonas sp. SORGH_AS_0993 TaxID=3041794 RepID=UPI00277FC018|nr:hypothetical protein [Brevundimonas sp. SORGH_AS_0993]MDQ1154163.1 hypothetical protein [Brevundimonas sp. SORGH_AS_0993]
MNLFVKSLAFGAAALTAVTPAAAETWSLVAATDRNAYLVDLDALAPIDGVVTTRLARVPAQGPATDLSHETEEVMVRCADGRSRAGATVTYDVAGTETDRSSEDTPWEATPAGGVYGPIKSFACDNLRPTGKTWPTIQAFIEDGRGG